MVLNGNFINRLMSYKKHLIVLLFYCTLTLMIFMVSNKLPIKSEIAAYPNDRVILKPQLHIILIWTKFYGLNFKGITGKTSEDLHCAIDSGESSQCLFTTDKSLLNHSSSLLFHWYDIVASKAMVFPSHRRMDQSWVLFNRESPVWKREIFIPKLNLIDGKFNWTMSYRYDSDVFAPYGFISAPKESSMYKYKRRVSFEKKSKEVSWIVSHCSTYGLREDYVEELMKYIDVDIYGKCAEPKLDCLPYRSDECYRKIESEYKFYLSFENALCKDYATEKIFTLMMYDIIPVVLGGANYSQFLPPHSYINALDFKSPLHLARYLKKVGSDAAVYDSYFKWKKNFVVIDTDPAWSSFCNLCDKLINNKQQRVAYDITHYSKWWYIDGQCRDWKGNVIKF